MSRLGQINRIKHVLDIDTLVLVINCLVFSKLFYCSNVWSNTSSTNLDQVQQVQNFASRIISGARNRDHITPTLKHLRWLPTRQQLHYPAKHHYGIQMHDWMCTNKPNRSIPKTL